MRQYLDAKRQHRDAIVFFRMGDFYEMFYEDALVAARALDLTLTSRSKDSGGNGIPMCGVPFHAVDGYLAKLVKKGFRVAICEQVEDPKKAKGLVRREVVRVVSPGTLTDGNYLDAREPAYLMAIVRGKGEGGRRTQGSGNRRSLESHFSIYLQVNSRQPSIRATKGCRRLRTKSRRCVQERSSLQPNQISRSSFPRSRGSSSRSPTRTRGASSRRLLVARCWTS
jgi:DNA mismatch repair ATPase MutS